MGRVGGYSQAVAGVDHYALLGERSHVLMLDIADPATPRIAWRSADMGDDVRVIKLHGHLALVIAVYALHILDITDPAYLDIPAAPVRERGESLSSGVVPVPVRPRTTPR